MANAAIEILKNRVSTEVGEQSKKVSLKSVDAKPMPDGLAKIKALLGSDRHTAEYVYTHLTKKQQVIVCYSAGLTKADTEKSYHEFNKEQRIQIHQAVLQLQEIVTAFVDANAMSPARFLQKRDFSVTKKPQQPAQAH
ncbi:hypothetical protein HJP15_07500 [Pseudoalteromonas sp. NEC-BIFX-2020_002]|uniref:hypothetical protein n=1 Tax=Pseudoalteromonas sp. NEC-BIFX-2020_002 TaxID=2732353 RepID=UPI001477336B|nr:hypothetical protein [Pseudoalteromonas sp. NEC-BIFX-2020_002]NNG42763.1 hypothetical protein [Pseudoalteromonas sp. NEC-BIFX-2020_002]